MTVQNGNGHTSVKDLDGFLELDTLEELQTTSPFATPLTTPLTTPLAAQPNVQIAAPIIAIPDAPLAEPPNQQISNIENGTSVRSAISSWIKSHEHKKKDVKPPVTKTDKVTKTDTVNTTTVNTNRPNRFRQSIPGKIMRIVGVTLLVLLTVVFAAQTWDLINRLFPDQNILIKVISVFSIDGCYAVWALLKMLYRFSKPISKSLAKTMSWSAFALSCTASVLDLILSSTDILPHKIDPTYFVAAFIIVIVAFVGNIIAGVVVADIELGFSHPMVPVEVEDKIYSMEPKAADPVLVALQEQEKTNAAMIAALSELSRGFTSLSEATLKLIKPSDSDDEFWEKQSSKKGTAP